MADPEVVPLGTLTLVAGVGGLGKSALVLAWAKRSPTRAANVLVVSYEDAAEQVHPSPLRGARRRPRPAVRAVRRSARRDRSRSRPTSPSSTGTSRETEARLVMIDPVSASIDLKLDAHRDQDVRVVLGQLAQARRAAAARGRDERAPEQGARRPTRICGSTARPRSTTRRRSVLTVTRDPGEPSWHRLVAHHKSNYGPSRRSSAGRSRSSRCRRRPGRWRSRGSSSSRSPTTSPATTCSPRTPRTKRSEAEALIRGRARRGPPAVVRGEGGGREAGISEPR